MNIAENVNEASASSVAAKVRGSMKIAGVTGARDRGDGVGLRANFNHGNYIHGAAARRLLASYKELDIKFRYPLSERVITHPH